MKKKDWIKPAAKAVVEPLHHGLVFDRRVTVLAQAIANVLPPGNLKGLDVGCGDGILGKRVEMLRDDVSFEGLDVLVRPNACIKVTEFDGANLPFADDDFDFCMMIDVLHHTHNQVEILRECLRVAKDFVLIKDHLCESLLDSVTLRFMDWVGNKAHGVDLPYLYLSGEGWQQLYNQCNAAVETVHPKLNIYPQPASLVFDRDLHFLSKIRLRK